MLTSNQELQELCEANAVDFRLLQDLIKLEKGRLSSSRGTGHNLALENLIRNYLR